MMLALGFPLRIFASGIFSGIDPVLTELLPDQCARRRPGLLL